MGQEVSGSSFPLDKAEKMEILHSVIAEEAIGSWSAGVEFQDMARDTDIKDHAAKLVEGTMTPEEIESATSDPEITDVLSMINDYKKKLMAAGHSEQDAANMITGIIIESIITTHLEEE